MQSMRFAMGLAAVLQLGQVGLAHAQETTSSAPVATAPIDDIVITARRRSEALSQVPVAATALTGDMLDRQGISNLQQLGNLTPGLQITSTIFIDSIFVRGVGSSPNDPGFEQQTGLFVDGVYYGNGRWVNSASFDAESVEILAGPQGVYFGKNTIAGAVNIATRNPTDEFEGYFKTGYELNAEEIYGEAVLSGPLTDTLGARLAVRLSDMDGWARNTSTGGGEPGSEDGVARLTLAWAPSEDFDANLKLQVQNYEDNGPTARTILLNCAGPGNTPAVPSAFGAPIWGPASGAAPCEQNFDIPVQNNLREGEAYTRVPAYTTALTLRWRNEYGELTSTTGLNRYSFKSYADLNSATLNTVESQGSARNTTASTELRYQSTLEGPLNFMLGAYFSSSEFTNRFSPSILPAAVQGDQWTFEQQSQTDGETRSYSAEVLWDITDTLELDLGVRYTEESKDTRFDTLSVAPFVGAFFPPMHFDAEQDFDNTSPQVTLTWRPNTDFMAYAAYKTGFLSGGFAHAQITSPTSLVSDFLFGPEEVRGGEIGVKFSAFDRHLFVDTVAYFYEYDGLQLSTFQPESFTFAVENAGQAEAQGVELRARWRTDYGLAFSGALAYGTSEYTEFVGGCLPTSNPATDCTDLGGGVFVQDFAGDSTSFAPEWSGRFAIDYSRETISGGLLNAGFGINYSDEYVVGDIFTQDGWVKYDARLALDFDRWSAAIIGNNLSNEAICNQAASRPLGGAGEVKCWLDRGREIRLEATVRF